MRGRRSPARTTNQDGALAKGAAASPRFTSNPDGTVKDNLTGLIWLKLANCFGDQSWTTALSSVQGLASGACGLLDGSAPGDWRLPNLNEQLSLIDWGQPSGAALPAGHPFTGVVLGSYWTSTSRAATPGSAWTVSAGDGGITEFSKTSATFPRVWPVRDAR